MSKPKKKKCWTYFSKYIRLKYADENGMVKCVTCPDNVDPIHYKKAHAGHFIQGRGLSILFDERGVHPQCYKCNMYLGGNQLEYFFFMQEKYGMEVVLELRDLKNQTRKISDAEYDEMIEDLKDKLVGLDMRRDND